MKIVIQWILVGVVIVALSSALSSRFARASERTYCQVQISGSHPSGSQCFMDEVATGIYGNQLYCARVSVFCQ